VSVSFLQVILSGYYIKQSSPNGSINTSRITWSSYSLRWSLCHLSQSSISAYETNTPRWSHKFHPHLCTNWCLQIFIFSTYTSRLEHSVCWSPSQILVVCKRVSWSGRLSHDTPAVKGDAQCWIFAEELKNWRSFSVNLEADQWTTKQLQADFYNIDGCPVIVLLFQASQWVFWQSCCRSYVAWGFSAARGSCSMPSSLRYSSKSTAVMTPLLLFILIPAVKCPDGTYLKPLSLQFRSIQLISILVFVGLITLAVWLSGNIVRRINKATLFWARLILRWVTVLRYTVSVLNQATKANSVWLSLRG